MMETRSRTIRAIGGHVGDVDLAAVTVLVEPILSGGRGVLLALTQGERGHPTSTTGSSAPATTPSCPSPS
ncbi:hypothetical protein LRD69_30590 [Streptomyces sp. JH14]|uniref:hypothetical protein n=1 Tax=Streptomyces sp. JH14 TaxID=2793630 RepID=UPI0023F81FF9|nr:hypothetical protein [Streptomyces sp. JH14]MDF6046396.1 hypothetical protein [Streptomyces sp. JH14]